MDAEGFEDLHKAIEDGDITTVRQIVYNHAEELCFVYNETSALYKAFQCQEYEIISFLIHKGARFVGYEEEDLYDLSIDLDRVNHFLFDYNKRSEKSCVYRLMSISQSPQVLDAERLKALVCMYEYFLRSDIIKLLIKVLENVDFDIVFDFESDKINRAHRLQKEEAEVFGLTLTTVREIFIGAKDLLSGDHGKRCKVYGVVAEELCHMAMTVVFENDAKAYRKEDAELIREFRDIVEGVRSISVGSYCIESVVRDVFEFYDANDWECELIARVPHVIGIHGEELGKRAFQEFPELHSLFTFYVCKVLPKCGKYVDQSSNTKSDRIMKEISGKIEFISFKEKLMRPLKEGFPSFREYEVVEEGVSVIPSKCIKASALHVYHELKQVYGDQMDRKCLFFETECYEKKRKEILKAFKCKIFDHLVLVLDNKELHPRRLLCEYLDDFEEFKDEGRDVIIISNSRFLGPKFEEKAVEYKWDNLTDEYKDLRTLPVEYLFKGERMQTYIKKEIVPKLFSKSDIISIIEGDLIQVHDDADLHCQGYNPETYVERQFQATVIDERLFEKLPSDTCIFINGLRERQLKELSIDKSLVQWLEGPDDEIQKGRTIFINEKKEAMKFDGIIGKIRVKNKIVLQHVNKMFYLMNSEGDVWERYEKKMRQSEEDIVDLLKTNRTLIVSENAGCGKSTAISRLMRHAKGKFYKSWVLKVDLKKFSTKGEENETEDLLDDIFLMLGLRNGIEKCHLKKKDNQGDCFIFLDAFDEIPSECQREALKLVSFLRKNTDVRMMITTRMHHQQELEEQLNTFSLRLVPFDTSSQVNCLERLWKWKLKFPNGEGGQNKDKKAISRKIESIVSELDKEKGDSESHDLILALKEINLEDGLDSISESINGLDLKRLANCILDKTLRDKETLEFMGIPLHLFMVGMICFDGNFNAEIHSDIYSIYSTFIEQKILIYVQEKQGVSHDGRIKKNIIKKERENVYRIHTRLANQVVDGREQEISMDDDDLELCAGLGIVFISGAEIDFLHHTFAEFFKAESIRQRFNKECFIRVLFDERYSVVRRFISSALEKEKFENLTKEFFEDVHFLLEILRSFVDNFRDFCLHPYNVVLNRTRSFKVNSEGLSVAKIVKCLLMKFEKTVDSNSVNKFALDLKDELLSWAYGPLVGGCLTVKMLKELLNRNFKENYKLVFGAVRYNANPDEVIDLLEAYMYIQTAGDCDGNGTAESRCILRLLKTEDLEGRCLLYWAICNEEAKVFANILKFSKRVVGQDLFMDAIVRSKEYSDAMETLIKAVLSRVSGLLKAFHSVFGNEIKNLFDLRLKFCIFEGFLSIKNNFRDPFEEAVDLFIKCFGTETSKNVLLSCDSKNRYLIHSLVCLDYNIVQRLSVISSILADEDKMKEFLKREDGNLRNMFHFAAKNKLINFSALIQFCNENLGIDEVREMLLSADEEGQNVLHLICRYNSSETLVQNLNLIKDTLADVEKFNQLLKRKSKESNNVLHFAAQNSNKINISFLSSHLRESEIKELFIERNINRGTCLHSGANTYSKNLPVLMDFSYEIDKNRFQELVFAKDEEGNTFLHLFVRDYFVSNDEKLTDLVNLIVKSLKEKVPDEIFNNLLETTNDEGKKFPQMEGLDGKKVVECFESILKKKLLDEHSDRKKHCMLQ